MRPWRRRRFTAGRSRTKCRSFRVRKAQGQGSLEELGGLKGWVRFWRGDGREDPRVELGREGWGQNPGESGKGVSWVFRRGGQGGVMTPVRVQPCAPTL